MNKRILRKSKLCWWK